MYAYTYIHMNTLVACQREVCMGTWHAQPLNAPLNESILSQNSLRNCFFDSAKSGQTWPDNDLLAVLIAACFSDVSLYMYAYMYVCVYIHVYVCMYVCMVHV